MPAGAMHMTVRNFFRRRMAHSQHFNLIMQSATCVWVVGIQVHVELADLDDQRIAGTLIGLDRNDRTRHQILGVAQQMLDRHAHHFIGCARTVGELRRQRDIDGVTGFLARQRLLETCDDVAMTVQIVQWLTPEGLFQPRRNSAIRPHLAQTIVESHYAVGLNAQGQMLGRLLHGTETDGRALH